MLPNSIPPKGCMLYAEDNYKDQSLQGGESGYANETSAGWGNRVRSLKYSARVHP